MPGAPRALTLTLLAAVAVQAALVAAYLLSGRSAVVDLSGEANLPSWWSAVVLLAAATTAAALYAAERRLGRRPPWALAALALGFAGLSLEEVAGVHERVGHRLGAGGDAGEVSDWTLVYLPLLAFGAFVVVRVVAWLGRPLGRIVAAGLAVLALGVVGEVTLIGDAGEGLVETLIEECSEVLGTLLLGGALAVRLADALELLLLPRPHAEGATAGAGDAVGLEPPGASPGAPPLTPV